MSCSLSPEDTLNRVQNLMHITFKSLSIKGFTPRDHHLLYPNMLETMLPSLH